MVPLFQHILCHPVCPVIYFLNLNEILLPLSRQKSIILLLLLKLVHFYSIMIHFLMLSNKNHFILLN